MKNEEYVKLQVEELQILATLNIGMEILIGLLQRKLDQNMHKQVKEK